MCFSTILNVLIPVKRLNFTLVFYKAADHASSKVNIYLDTYFKNSQIHQVTMKYCFEHKNHEILINS